MTAKTRIRTYRMDGDTIDVVETYHEKSGNWVGDYPCFELDKRYTPNGRMWVDITCGDECPYCTADNDGGRCQYFNRERARDIIGVCFCEQLRLNQNKIQNHTGTKEAT